MKKGTLLFFLVVGLLSTINYPQVKAYSPHYLPNGKNYLSEDNFTLEDDHLVTDAPFLVKPYTNYCLTVTREYMESGAENIIINFYNNDEEIDSLTVTIATDLIILSGCYYLYMTFETSAQTNYIDLVFDDSRDFFSTNTIAQFMLEEGTISTAAEGIETYIEGNVIDTNGPILSGAAVIISDVDNPIEIDDIKAGMYAYDAIDEDVTNNITVMTDDYTENATTLGNYEIIFQVADSSENTTDFTCIVKVIDITKPVFSGPSEITVSYPNAFTINDLKAMIHASDNYDGDITANISIYQENYTESTNIVGEYQVSFAVADSSDNSNIFTMTIYVIDADYPLFYGVSEVTIGYDQTLTVLEIQNSLQAIDNYDGDLSAQIHLKTDGYSAYQHCIGDYVIVFEVEDLAGNYNQKTVIVRIIDEIGPIIYFDTSIIKVYNSTILSMSDLTTLLKKSGELAADENYQLYIRYDSYSDHASIPGVYHLTLEYENKDGEILAKSLQIVVKNVSTQYVEAQTALPDEDSVFKQYQIGFVGGALILITIITNLAWAHQRKKVW